MSKHFVVALGLTAIVCAGCGSSTSDVAEPSPVTGPVDVVTAAATVPVVPTPQILPGATTPATAPVGLNPRTQVASVRESTTAPPFPDLGNLFAPPKEAPVEETKPEPEPEPAPAVVAPRPVETQPLPPIRLIGFIGVEDVRAMLSISGKLNIVKQGDSVEGLELTAITPPRVALKHGENEIEIDLFEQPGFDEQRRLPGQIRNSSTPSYPAPRLPGANGLGSSLPSKSSSSVSGVRPSFPAPRVHTDREFPMPIPAAPPPSVPSPASQRLSVPAIPVSAGARP